MADQPILHPPIERRCPVCGGPMTGMRSDALTCSRSCRRELNRAKAGAEAQTGVDASGEARESTYACPRCGNPLLFTKRTVLAFVGQASAATVAAHPVPLNGRNKVWCNKRGCGWEGPAAQARKERT